jgi:hypothetical protein
MMSAADIAAALGNPRREGRHWRCRCPVHGGHSLTLRDGRARLLVKCWAGCDARDVLAELRCIGLIAGHSEGARPPSVVRTAECGDAARRTALARRIWDAVTDARGTPVERYFAGRGIIASVPSSLRWAPSLRHPDGTAGPAMVARVDGLDGELVGVHRTYLARDTAGIWHRRDRACLGPIAGGAVRLAPAAETVLIAEGIETTLAAMQATALPAWAALSTSGMRALVLPPIVRDVLIAVDRDANGTGERAARTAALRWLAEGRRVRLAIPHVIGADIADLIQREAHHAA